MCLFPSYVESKVIVKFNQLSTDFVSYFSGNFWRKYSSSGHDQLSTIAHITQSNMYYKIVWTNFCFLQCIVVPLSHRIWYFCPCIVLIVVILQYTVENRNSSTILKRGSNTHCIKYTAVYCSIIAENCVEKFLSQCWILFHFKNHLIAEMVWKILNYNLTNIICWL